MKRLIYVNFYLRIFCLIANTLRGVAFKIWLHLSTGSLSISGKCIVLYSIGHAFFHFGSVARRRNKEWIKKDVYIEAAWVALLFFFFLIYTFYTTLRGQNIYRFLEVVAGLAQPWLGQCGQRHQVSLYIYSDFYLMYSGFIQYI